MYGPLKMSQKPMAQNTHTHAPLYNPVTMESRWPNRARFPKTGPNKFTDTQHKGHIKQQECKGPKTFMCRHSFEKGCLRWTFGRHKRGTYPEMLKRISWRRRQRDATDTILYVHVVQMYSNLNERTESYIVALIRISKSKCAPQNVLLSGEHAFQEEHLLHMHVWVLLLVNGTGSTQPRLPRPWLPGPKCCDLWVWACLRTKLVEPRRRQRPEPTPGFSCSRKFHEQRGQPKEALGLGRASSWDSLGPLPDPPSIHIYASFCACVAVSMQRKWQLQRILGQHHLVHKIDQNEKADRGPAQA